jgi:hypothetical protein
MRIPEGTVRGRLRRAKRVLADRLTAQGGATADTTQSGLDTWARQLREYADRELDRSGGERAR